MSDLTTFTTQRPALAGRRATVLAEAVVSNYLREISPARPRPAAPEPRRLCEAVLRVRQPTRHTLRDVRARRGLTVSDPAPAA